MATMTRSNIQPMTDIVEAFKADYDKVVADNGNGAVELYARGVLIGDAGDLVRDLAFDLAKRFGATWGESDVARAFGLKTAAAKVMTETVRYLATLTDDGTPAVDVRKAVYAVHNQTGTGVVALSNFLKVKASKLKDGKTLPYKAVVSASDHLVKEAKKAGEEPKPEATPAEQVDAIIKRIERALNDLAPFTEAGYEFALEQSVKLAAIKARLA